MMNMVLLITILLLLLLDQCDSSIRDASINKIDVIDDVTGDGIVSEAMFALEELVKLSETKIYDTLSLTKVKSAYRQEGIFHYNTIMTIELSSPYFVSGNATEDFEIIVMQHKEDNVKSIAIDEFPNMDEKVSRQFLRKKIIEKRKEREVSFRKLELQALLFDDFYLEHQQHNYAVLEDIPTLLESLDNQSLKDLRQKNSETLQRRLQGQQLKEEQEIINLSLSSLFNISIRNVIEASDFQIERSIKLLDLSIAQLQLEKAEAGVTQAKLEAVIVDNGEAKLR